MGEHGKFNSIQGESGMDWLEITDDVLRHKPFSRTYQGSALWYCDYLKNQLG
jgi:hypothetical protein